MDIFIDSGAWSAWSQKGTVDIDAYIAFIKKHHKLITVYANLDVIGDGRRSYKNWRYMRQQGLDPLPVYHAESDIIYLKRYLKECKYIAIGAISNMSTNKRIENLDHIWMDYLVDKNRMPKVKVHGFGLTSLQIMFRYPWYSVDSTSWVSFSRYGLILIPEQYNGKYMYDRPPRPTSLSIRSPAKKVRGQHFDNLGAVRQEKVREYVHNLGFKLGKSEIGDDGKEIKVEDGLRNNNKLRDQFNFLFYVKAEQAIGEWPRPLGIKAIQKGLLV